MTHLSPHKSDDLSFVTARQEGGYNYWNVTPVANEDGYLTGQRLGNEFLAFIGRFPSYGNSTLLGCIVNDMIAAREGKASRSGKRLSDIERGFLSQVTGYAMATARVVHHADAEPTAA